MSSIGQLERHASGVFARGCADPGPAPTGGGGAGGGGAKHADPGFSIETGVGTGTRDHSYSVRHRCKMGAGIRGEVYRGEYGM